MISCYDLCHTAIKATRALSTTTTSTILLPQGVKVLPHPTCMVYLLGSRHDSCSAAKALDDIIQKDNKKETLALGLELCHGRIGRMRFVNSKDIKALWQFSHTCKSPITIHALDVSPGEAAKEVFRDISLCGIFNITYYILLRRILSPLAERILVWRIIYGNNNEIPLIDKWLIKWRVPLPIMRMIRGMCSCNNNIDDIRNAIINKYPPKERISYIRDSTLDCGGYIKLCDKYNIDKRLQEVVINMRDEYMFRSLWRLASNNKRIAAVVGENHVNGIENRWLSKLNNNTTSSSSPRPNDGIRKFKFEEGGVLKQWLLMELLKQ